MVFHTLVGSAYAYKVASNNQMVMCYFGEGAASEGDSGVSFNFAATLRCPVVFFCRNNGYAISTPANEQYGGDGVAGVALGHGLHSIRVDGNDVFAVYAATLAGRRLALEGKPCLIEAITYRVGHHSTSDDSTSYRSKLFSKSEEVQFWTTYMNPRMRLKKYLMAQNLLTEEDEKNMVKAVTEEIMKALASGEKKMKPSIKSMLSDVYEEATPRLKMQEETLEQHLKLYEDFYPTKKLFA
ncbi:unnamed protein product [Soboliphyme baturini]|uniref:2-oxoisovalerate dehydrogenase subunit alpha n=1 Tax=Soboliphyme baturini TaxID=241478 RepID=A0A183I9N0_9BILA|nr:unnamed protein product [Soboliphyme baturini]